MRKVWLLLVILALTVTALVTVVRAENGSILPPAMTASVNGGIQPFNG